MSFGTTPLSTTSLAANQFPVSAVAVPGESGGNLTALEGGPESTDGNGNKTAPASIYIKDGGNISLGAQADTAATTDTGTFSLISLVKRSLQKLTSLVTNTSAFLDTATTSTVTNDGDTVSISLPGGQATVLVNVLMGTLVGTLLFEASPDSGTTWVSVNGSQAGTASIATSATAAGVWRVGVAGFTNFRVRLHPVVSGTSGTITLRVTQGVHNVAVVNASALGQAVMANSAPVVLASDQSTIPVKGGFTEQAGLSAGSLNAFLVPATDVSAYKWLSLHINATAWSGVLTMQCSNDNINWASVDYNDSAGSGYRATITSLTNVLYHGPVYFRYFRVQMTTYTSGTAQGTLELYTEPTVTSFIGIGSNGSSVSQSGTWTVQPGNTQNTTAWLVNTPSSDLTVFASGAQTSTQTQADQTNNTAKGIKVVLDMTNVGSSPSVTLEIDGKDAASGKYYSILTGAAVITVSTNVYTIYPGLTASTNVAANDVLPHTWRVKVVANNANSGTYSVGASLLP